MTINQTAPVTDEELVQMIWKLERDGGMTPKMLSLMRELREVRRAKGEPVARELQEHSEAVATPIYQLFDMGWYDTNKQTHDNAVSAGCAGRIVYTAPPAPTVSLELVDLLSMAASAIEDLLEHTDPNTSYYSGVWADVPGKLRAAIQSFGNSEQLEPVSNRDEFPTNSFTNEELAGMAHGDNPQANAYRELLAFRRNSPATPDGWIPVRERMPEVGDIVLTAIDGCMNVGEAERSGANYRYFTSVISGRELPATHWQPMPAAPKEVKGE